MTLEMLLDRLLQQLNREPRVAAAWVDGSLARGFGDEHSDLDIGIAATDDNPEDLLSSLPDLLGGACELVLVQIRGRLLNLVTSDWQRVDVFVRTQSEARRGVPGPVRVIHDPTGCVHVLEPAAPPLPIGDRFDSLVREFIRYLGLLPVVVHRDEWIGAYVATGTMMGMLAELMQLENGTQRIGGALRLSERLTEQQRDELGRLPDLSPGTSSVVAVQVALAHLFLTRARGVAVSLHLDYPATLEDAARRHLARFDIEVPI